jgi:hypothetical protein
MCRRGRPLQRLDDAHAGRIQVQLGILAVGQVPLDKGAGEGGVHALGTEDVQEVAQIGGLLLLIADVVALEPHGRSAVGFDDLAAAGSVV